MAKNNFDIATLNKLAGSSKDLFFAVTNKLPNKSSIYSSNVESITGYTSEEIISLSEKHYSLVVNEDLEKVKTDLAVLEMDPEISSIILIYRINSKSGALLWLREHLAVTRDNKGSVAQKISIIFNITSEKQKESETQNQINTLKEQNSSKDKFISIVSHDLRAPFTTLLGFSEILINEQDISEEEKNEYLQYIYDASKMQLDFINCLLDWSRLQTGRVKLEPARLDVKHTIANAVAPLTGTAVRKTIEIKIDVPDEIYVNADERLISQAIVHLVNNAVKYSEEGKKVFITASRFKEGMIEVVITDQGVGISEENQIKIFRLDQKLALPGTSGEKGSGMGLTLTKEIIEKHGGQIWFYSQPGEGSEFHFTIPEAKNSVLIVEDDLNVRAMYKSSIEDNLPNFEVKTADNGYEAIGVVRKFLPTVVITNHDMPLMDGIQLVEAINKKDSGRNIPVIVISKILTDDNRRVYSRLGVDKIIPKPVDLELLISTVRECLFES